jgi:F0F1-type ATP synthase epsilon subunit
MADSLRLRVWSPSETLLDIDQLSNVVALLPDGEIGLLPGHTVLLAETVDGEIRYYDAAGSEHKFDLFGGILKVENNQVLIFTGGARRPDSDLLRSMPVEADIHFDRLARQLMEVLNLESG